MDLFQVIKSGGDTEQLSRVIRAYPKSVHSLDDKGNTPLHAATLYSQSDMVVMLLRAKANTDAQDNYGLTPLHIAVGEVKTDCLLALLRFDANPNYQNENGETPLHFASQYGHPESVQLLLQHDADPTIRDKNGLVPAQMTDHISIRLLFQEHEEGLDNFVVMDVSSRNRLVRS